MSEGCVHAVMHLNLCVAMETVMLRLYSLLFDIHCMYLFSVTEKKPVDPEL